MTGAGAPSRGVSAGTPEIGANCGRVRDARCKDTNCVAKVRRKAGTKKRVLDASTGEWNGSAACAVPIKPATESARSARRRPWKVRGRAGKKPIKRWWPRAGWGHTGGTARFIESSKQESGLRGAIRVRDTFPARLLARLPSLPMNGREEAARGSRMKAITIALHLARKLPFARVWGQKLSIFGRALVFQRLVFQREEGAFLF